EMREKRAKYYHDLRAVQKVERNFFALSYERERAAAKRKELDAERTELVKELDARGAALRESVAKLADEKQVASAGPYLLSTTSLQKMNLFISFSILAIGFCLMAGLFTRLAALGGAAFLLQIYLSMPPWPGLPVSPKAEGHYFIVDKNLVEMLACMALVFLPTGHWVGLDALLFGKRRHARALARAEREGRELAGETGRRAHSHS
ncbi:MAG: DoxX family protein, partial [Planctomycetia bacterium]|nr:DoxX family protein [Planctomycetia bacterium]